MRVAIVTESFLPQVNGVTNSVLRVLEHLQRAGHQAMVLAPGEPPPSVYGACVVGLPSMPLPGYPEFRVGIASTRSLGRQLEVFEPDVVHLASPFVTGGPAVRAAARLGIPVVAVYQTDVAGFATRYRATIATDTVWRRLRFIHDRAALTLAPSLSSLRTLEAHGVERVRLWSRGVDTRAFSATHQDPALHAELSPDGRPLVGFVGRLAAEKQVEDLRVLHDRHDVRLVVVGDGPERDGLQRLLPRAHFLGLLTGPRLSQALATLDVLVQPSPHETFCQAAQEAMASAVPVVAVAAGGAAELVDSSRTGWLYPPGDLRALRARALDLCGDPAKRRAMGAAAADAVRSRTWPVVCEQLLGHYASAVQLPDAVTSGR